MTNADQLDEPHEILWRNVQTMRISVRSLAETAEELGNDEAVQARLLVERKLSAVNRGSTLDELWESLELLYRQLTAVAVFALGKGQDEASKAFVGSAGSLLGLIQPQLSEDERHELLMNSLEKRAQEGAV